jgi:hypothetical protein
MAQYTHNTWKNESTQASPFDLLIGHTPTIQVEEKDLAVPEIARRKEWLERGRLRAFAALRNAQKAVMQRMQRRKGERHYQGFKKGDSIWLEGTNLRLSHPNAKLAPKRYGPFKVIEQISPVVFQLELPTHWTIHNVFHALLLMPFRETTEYGTNYPEPPPDLEEGDNEYEVD